jgi:hypothetical protein
VGIAHLKPGSSDNKAVVGIAHPDVRDILIRTVLWSSLRHLEMVKDL